MKNAYKGCKRTMHIVINLIRAQGKSSGAGAMCSKKESRFLKTKGLGEGYSHYHKDIGGQN